MNGPATEDALAYLPCSTIASFGRGQIIYDYHQPSSLIYLVIDGKVKVTRLADTGRPVIVDIYQPDEFFGEAAFLNQQCRHEQAIALETTKVMTWPAPEIESLVMKQPRLGVALVQMAAQRIIESIHRIQSFSADNIARRLVRSLLRFAERLGEPEVDGLIRMLPFTHEMLAQYIGTSREIVTHWMARFQREGYLTYSRDGILLRREALNAWLRESSETAETADA